MKKLLVLCGWGQQADSLDGILPEGYDISRLDYSVYPSMKALKASVKNAPAYDLVVAWSLGAQIVMEFLSAGLIKAKKLIFISPPYQYVNDDPLGFGVPTPIFNAFVTEYDADPKGLLDRFRLFTAQGDKFARRVAESLKPNTSAQSIPHWSYWLKHLDHFCAKNIPVSKFPPTLIIHGRDDAVTHVGQAQLLSTILPESRVEVIEQCGHAPHLHDPARVKALIDKACNGVV